MMLTQLTRKERRLARKIVDIALIRQCGIRLQMYFFGVYNKSVQCAGNISVQERLRKCGLIVMTPTACFCSAAFHTDTSSACSRCRANQTGRVYNHASVYTSVSDAGAVCSSFAKQLGGVAVPIHRTIYK